LWVGRSENGLQEQEGALVDMVDKGSLVSFGFKSPLKNIFPALPCRVLLTSIGVRTEGTKNSFPKSSKKYQLHYIHPYGTYFIDFALFGRFAYLFCIDFNSRFLMARAANVHQDSANKLIIHVGSSDVDSYLSALSCINDTLELILEY
jgi:hypothetical protein